MATAPASAADMMSVGVGGFMQQWVGYASRNDPGAKGGTAVQSDSEVHFKGSLESEMGLTFTTHIELQADGGEEAIDETYVRVSGEFGQIEFGSRDHAMVRMHSGIKDVGIGLSSGDTQKWIPGTYLETAGHGSIGGGNDLKLNYISPRAAGLQVGLSYAPKEGAGTTDAPAGNDDASWGAGLNFQQAVGDMAVTFSLGHRSLGSGGMTSHMVHTGDGGFTRGHYKAVGDILELWRTHLDEETIAFDALPAFDIDGNGDETGPFEAAVNEQTDANLDQLRDAAYTARGRMNAANAGRATVMREVSDQTYTNVGFGVGFGAFGFNLAYAVQDVAETYMVMDDHEVVVDPANTGNFDGNSLDSAAESEVNNDPDNDIFRQAVAMNPSNDATVWGASVSYSDGPMSVSLGHMMHEEDSGGERTSTMVSASYTMAPGVAWKSSVFAVEDTTSAVDDRMNEGTGFVTGIALSF